MGSVANVSLIIADIFTLVMFGCLCALMVGLTVLALRTLRDK